MKDLTNLKTFIIDSENPNEIDDAVSLEIGENNVKYIWVHISYPCKLFEYDSDEDIKARGNCSSIYLIDKYIPMLSKEIIDKANLKQNKLSETISACIEINENGSIKGYELTEAIIKAGLKLPGAKSPLENEKIIKIHSGTLMFLNNEKIPELKK